MARLPHVDARDADEVVAAVFAGFQREGRESIALHRVLAHAPKMLRAFSGVGRGLRYEATIPRPLLELVVLRVAQLTGSNYVWSHHKAMALDVGVPEGKLEALAGWRGSEAFDGRERAVLRCAEEMHEIALSEGAFAELRRHFGPAEIVEILLTVAHYTSVAQILQALDVEIEPEYRPFAADGSP